MGTPAADYWKQQTEQADARIAELRTEAADAKNDALRLHLEKMVLYSALIEMRARDDQNGSLPPAYRSIIDEALAPQTN